MSSCRTQSGLVPTLIKGLTTHAALAQDATNATTAYRALSHLQRCRSEFNSLSLLIDTGRLPEAAGTCETLNVLLDEAPRPLNQADIMGDMRVSIYAPRCTWYTKEISSEGFVQLKTGRKNS